MIRYTEHCGIYFTEGVPASFKSLGRVSIEIGGVIREAQLKSLDDVKTELAQRVKTAGGNAVVGFRYGQKSVGFWASLFQLDDVNWYGSGEIAVVAPNCIQESS